MFLNFIAASVLILLGIYIMAVKKNLVKIVMGMVLLVYGINLFMISIGFNASDMSYLYLKNIKGGFLVDPILEYMTIAFIGISSYIIIIALSIIIRIKILKGTAEVDELGGKDKC